MSPESGVASTAEALKTISRNLRAVPAVHNQGRDAVYTALEIQSIYLEKALAFLGSHPPDLEEEQWIGIYSQVLDGLKTLKVSLPDVALEDDDAELRRRIDWVLCGRWTKAAPKGPA